MAPGGRKPSKSPRTPKQTPNTTKAKRRSRRQSTPLSDADPQDPFNFDAHGNDHPQPFELLKGDFGNVKFLRAPDSAQSLENRYAKTEKIASRNSTSLNQSAISAVANSSYTSITALTTTPKARKELAASSSTGKSSTKRGRKVRVAVDEDDDTPPGSESDASRTPRKKRDESNHDLFPPKPKVEIKMPNLELAEQRDVDMVDHEPYPTGMRVYALWGREFYPAVIFDRDAFGRYKVVFTEDEQNRDVPGTGIIPLAKLTPGKQVAIITNDDGQELDTPVEVIHAPSTDNLEEWSEGMFQIRDAENEEAEVQTVSWKKLLITKLQQKDMMQIKNVVVSVANDNVVPRSARRSRIAATSAINNQQTPTAPKSANRSNTQRSAKKSSVAEEEPNKSEPKTETQTPKKRPRGRASAAEEKESPAAKRPALEEAEEEVEEEKPAETEEETAKEPIFNGYHFMLTSSARRPTGATHFNKRDCKLAIELRGGVVAEEIDEIVDLPEGARAFLVADTFYRTHKYLFALASSVPTVHHNWIDECLKANKVIDHTEFLLPAGKSILDDKEYPWKPLKGELLKNKKLFVHSMTANQHQHQENVVPFSEIWRPLLSTLGAEIITTDAADEKGLVLTDRSCTPELIAVVEQKEVPVVSSNWIIHTIVTGEWAPVSAHPTFSPLA
ncbi:hypothetical protein M3Y98_00519200 [Aphelenchoides besseyi]|nr:hypothetical protein M3Y98_00519200 [Aphelenchoides besseyi]KAI6207929.1 hypothetical protein M3Y96_00060800 [Aphelenchoides besseyi]